MRTSKDVTGDHEPRCGKIDQRQRNEYNPGQDAEDREADP